MVPSPDELAPETKRLLGRLAVAAVFAIFLAFVLARDLRGDFLEFVGLYALCYIGVLVVEWGVRQIRLS